MLQTQHAPQTRGGRADVARRDGTAILVPVAVDAVVDAASMLVALHGRIERQFALYEQAEGSQRGRYQLMRAIGSALATHVALEDELLYPALQAHTANYDPEIERQLEQDHLLDMIMVELGGMIPADRRFDAKVRVLMQVFRQHARDSETLLLPELRQRLDPGEREQLSHRLLERLGQLESRPWRRGW
jgi:hemerythrin superfamily protein